VTSDEPVPVLLGLEEAPPLELPAAQFAYAGQYRMRRYGKAVLTHRPDRPTQAAEIIAAVTTDRHRRHRDRLVVRRVDVRRDARGQGWGPALLQAVLPAAAAADFHTAQINVNNPFAYIAVSKAGFVWTGRTTGLAELIMIRPTDRPCTPTHGRFIAGLSLYRRRLSPAGRRLIARYRRRDAALGSPRAVDEMIPAHHTSQSHG
jgi:hypothetical protein